MNNINSKTLSWILRHGINKLKLNIRNDGFVLIDDLINVCESENINVTLDILNIICKKDAKNRFTINEDKFIRANQGHSIKNDLSKLLIKITNINNIPKYLIYVTNENAVKKIKYNGVKKMSRTHIHLVDNENSNLVRNMSQCNYSVNIDAHKLFENNIDIYKSTNGMYFCSDVIDMKYVISVTERKPLNCAGVIVISQNKYVLMVKTHKNHYSYPKGKRNKKENETTIETAKRELEEETGIKLDKLDYQFGMQYDEGTIRYLLAFTDELHELNPIDKNEVKDAKWMQFNDVFNINCYYFNNMRKNILREIISKYNI